MEQRPDKIPAFLRKGTNYLWIAAGVFCSAFVILPLVITIFRNLTVTNTTVAVIFYLMSAVLLASLFIAKDWSTKWKSIFSISKGWTEASPTRLKVLMVLGSIMWAGVATSLLIVVY